jgi:hypothetical protein
MAYQRQPFGWSMERLLSVETAATTKSTTVDRN